MLSLTDLGRRVLRRMNELGVVVDVSHLSEASFWEVLKVTRGALGRKRENHLAHEPGGQDRRLPAGIERRTHFHNVAADDAGPPKRR